MIATSPIDILQRIAPRELLEIDGATGKVEYLGVLCLVLLTKRSLMPYYVLNVADGRLPFTGVIGMSNIVSPEETAGRHLTYLPKYVLSTDPLLRRSDSEIRELFMEGVNRLFPDLEPAEIEAAHIHRAFRVQPLQVLGYSRLVPDVTTRNADFYVLNTAQFVNGTLNNNNVVRAVDEFVETHRSGFRAATATSDEPAMASGFGG